jgi:arylformamidase
MRIIDLSLPLDGDTPVYPGDPPVEVAPLSRADGHDSFGVSRLVLGSHSGTHIDPPAHLFPGAVAVDAIDLGACIGPALVVDLTAADGAVGRAEVADLLPGTKRVLLRTGGRPLSVAAASLLVERRLRLVGIDASSVAPLDEPAAVHRILLAAGIVILEGLDLTAAPAGAGTLIALPLRLRGGDGAPARAVLLLDG